MLFFVSTFDRDGCWLTESDLYDGGHDENQGSIVVYNVCPLAEHSLEPQLDISLILPAHKILFEL